tara:strand:- start:55 stop:1083 length:1029 start_codon:yes stop_codon:yes gene_type:complete
MIPVDKSVFDTEDLPSVERFKAWQESIGVIFDVTLDDRVDPLAFNARLEAMRLGQILLGKIVSQTQRFQRSREKIISDRLDCYLVQVFLKGSCEMQDGRHIRKVRPGDVYIIDAGAPLDAVNYDFSNLTAIIPRDLMSRDLIRPDAHHRRVIPGDTPLAKMLYDYICNIHANSSSMPVDDAVIASSALLALTQGLLNARLPKAPGQLDDETIDIAIRAKVIDFIDANLGDHSLNPSHVVAALGISRTRLYRLFEPYGGVAAEIRHRRLRCTLQDLFDQKSRTMRISEVALRGGFGSESDYIRAFKRRYNMTPSEARAARSVTLSSATKRNYEYEKWIASLAP